MEGENLEPPDRITIGEIAGKYAVYKALHEGIIPGVRMGNRWMVSRVSFQRWLETCGTVLAEKEK